MSAKLTIIFNLAMAHGKILYIWVAGIFNHPAIFFMEEIWRDIEGYEGLYQASNLGRVKSLWGRSDYSHS